MKVNGTLVNYYIHCKRQCYLHGNRLNLEDNSEDVKIGKALHEARESENTEIVLDNIRLDKLTKTYLIEVKKSDVDIEAAKWQLIYYLFILKQKGVIRTGKLECIEKKTKEKKTQIIELNEELEKQLEQYIIEIENLIKSDDIPEPIEDKKCKKCAYFDYCYIG